MREERKRERTEKRAERGIGKEGLAVVTMNCTARRKKSVEICKRESDASSLLRPRNSQSV